MAGLEAIAVEGVENVDLSEVVEGHGDYERKLRVVLERVGFCWCVCLDNRWMYSCLQHTSKQSILYSKQRRREKDKYDR